MIDTMSEKDNNLDRIIDQQAYIKQIIEKDGRISYLKKSISDNNNAIEAIRKHCSKISFDNQNEKQDLIKVQATEIERFQMQQLRSINDDYRRHEQILDMKRNEKERLKKDYESEEKNRDSYLADVEKKLEIELQDHQTMNLP